MMTTIHCVFTTVNTKYLWVADVTSALESGNGDYSLAVKDTRIASAGTETGWSGVPAGRMIYGNRYPHRNDLSDSNRQRHTRNLHFTNQGGR